MLRWDDFHCVGHTIRMDCDGRKPDAAPRPHHALRKSESEMDGAKTVGTSAAFKAKPMKQRIGLLPSIRAEYREWKTSEGEKN